jgi:hypothetical protein
MAGSKWWTSWAATLAGLTLGPLIGHASAQTPAARDIVGMWAEDDGQLKFEVHEVGDTYEARIIHSGHAMEADGRTFKADILNPDPALRSLSLKGTVILSGLRRKPETGAGREQASTTARPDGPTRHTCPSWTGIWSCVDIWASRCLAKRSSSAGCSRRLQQPDPARVCTQAIPEQHLLSGGRWITLDGAVGSEAG